MQALFQIGPVEGEENVEHMLRGVGLPQGQVSLQDIEPGGRAMAYVVTTVNAHTTYTTPRTTAVTRRRVGSNASWAAWWTSVK